MSLLFIAPGFVSMDTGDGRPALWRGGGAIVDPPPDPAPLPATPGDIDGLAGWWDGGLASGLRDSFGATLASLSGVVASIFDKSGNGRHLVPTATARASARANGLLGGVGSPTGAAGLAPQLDASLGFQVSGLAMGSGAGWTRYLVWTRPNLRLGTSQNGSPVALLTVGSTVVLQLDSVAGGRLVLFPGSGEVVLSQTMVRRHTHNVIERYTVGFGVSVWLDGVQVGSGGPNPLPTVNTATMTLLHDTTPQGGAQCWFHEAAAWDRSLSSDEIGALILATPRWKCGPRRGVNLLVVGQSNAGLGISDGAWLAMARGIAWHLGAASYGVIAQWGGSSYTCASGHGIYDVRTPPDTGAVYLPGDFIHNPADGSDPSGYALGSDGAAVQAYLASQPAADVADIAAILWPWNETDSTRGYSEKQHFQSGAQNLLARLRTVLGRSAAQMPLLWWNAMPFWTDPGVQMVREVMATMAALEAQNVVAAIPMTADTNPRGSTWDASTGLLLSAGDGSHLDATDLVALGQRGAGSAARVILASSGGDTITSIPPGVPNAGPRIVHAYRASNTQIVVTVAHDSGNDLLVPLQAANGAGWAVMDGGSVSTPGTIRIAVSCERVDATHLRITLSSALTSPSTGCGLFYPYGSNRIGRGNAVTDNQSAVAKPAGWSIGSDLGSAWDVNRPLQATTTPVLLSDSQM